jgi:hypothetical protein
VEKHKQFNCKVFPGYDKIRHAREVRSTLSRNLIDANPCYKIYEQIVFPLKMVLRGKT